MLDLLADLGKLKLESEEGYLAGQISRRLGLQPKKVTFPADPLA